jgi:NADP-dependent 3-hydroxy acid dehydrogenase YdfG
MENSKMNTNDKNMKPVAVVTGSSSGIGYETSLLMARNGFLPELQCVTLINLANSLI